MIVDVVGKINDEEAMLLLPHRVPAQRVALATPAQRLATKMKTLGSLILVAAICVAIFWIFMGLRPAPAHATVLPDTFVGKWCATSDDADVFARVLSEEDWQRCERLDRSELEATASIDPDDGYCAFDSIEQVGERSYWVHERCDTPGPRTPGREYFYHYELQLLNKDQLRVTPLSEG